MKKQVVIYYVNEKKLPERLLCDAVGVTNNCVLSLYTDVKDDLNLKSVNFPLVNILRYDIEKRG
jgi:hypothetical protein